MAPVPRLAVVYDRVAVGLSCREAQHAEAFEAAGVSHWADHRRTRCGDEVLGSLPGVTYLWHPTRDDGEPKPLAWYGRTLGFASGALAVPGALLVVTCARGHHRGPSMVYGILRAIYGFSPGAAGTALRDAWPDADPWYADDIDAKLSRLRAAIGFP